MSQPPLRSPLLVGPHADEALSGFRLRDIQAYGHSLTSSQVANLASPRSKLPTGISLPWLPEVVAEIWGSLNRGDRPTILALVAKGLGWEDPEHLEFAQEVKRDFYVDLFQFSLEICLTSRKAAVSAGIVESIFGVMHARSQTTACIGERYSVSESFLEYKRLLLAHSVMAPSEENRVPVLTLPEAKQLTDFMTDAFFRHYTLYQSVLVRPQESTTVCVEAEIAFPRRPPDLSLARPASEVSHRKAAAKAAVAVAASACGGSTVGMPIADPRPTTPAVDEALGEGGLHAIDEGGSAKGCAAGGSRGETKEPADERYELTPDLDIHQHHARVSARAVQNLRESVKSHAQTVEGKLR